MNKIASIAAALFFFCGTALATGGAEIRLAHAPVNPLDTPSLQRGARDFINYCLNCHSARHMRYNRLTDLGLTEQQIIDNLMFSGRFNNIPGVGVVYVPVKVGETMQVTMQPADAKAWFGAPPPDLSVIERVRGSQWLYNYFKAFYRDDATPTGWNNLLFPNVGMPNVLWEMSGVNRLVKREYATHDEARGAALQAQGITLVEPARGGKYIVKTLEVETPGTMTPTQFDGLVTDLVNYMQYMAEPSKVQRERLGIIVLLFLGVLFVCAYWLKREYWKDVH